MYRVSHLVYLCNNLIFLKFKVCKLFIFLQKTLHLLYFNDYFVFKNN